MIDTKIHTVIGEDEENIEKILKHLNLWEIQNHDPPNDFKIPQQFEHFILTNSLLIGDNEKSNDNIWAKIKLVIMKDTILIMFFLIMKLVIKCQNMRIGFKE